MQTHLVTNARWVCVYLTLWDPLFGLLILMPLINVDLNHKSSTDYAGPPGPVSYSTTFALTENPISESGAWRTNLCSYFSTCQSTGGRVYGNQPEFANPGIYEDAYAHLSGTWAVDQRGEGVIDKRSTGGYEEFEIHLLGSDGSNFVKCYEIFVHQAGQYFTLAMWKGLPLTSPATIDYFDIMANVDNITAPADGDTLWAQIVGNTLTGGINGTTYINIDVTTGGRTRIPSGTPGIGFDAGGSGSEGPTLNYGFKSFYAVGL